MYPSNSGIVRRRKGPSVDFGENFRRDGYINNNVNHKMCDSDDKHTTFSNDANSNLHILSLNICSLRGKVDDFSILLAEKKPHIVLCVEHWLKSMEPVIFNDYCLLNMSNRSLGYGGTLILVDKDLVHHRFSLAVPCIDKDIEYCMGKCVFDDTLIVLVSVYRAPDGKYNVFFESLEQILSALSLTSDDILIVGGDFNLDLLDAGNQYVMTFLDLMSSFGLVPSNFMATHTTSHSSTNLDNIFIPKDMHCSSDVSRRVL